MVKEIWFFKASVTALPVNSLVSVREPVLCLKLFVKRASEALSFSTSITPPLLPVLRGCPSTVNAKVADVHSYPGIFEVSVTVYSPTAMTEPTALTEAARRCGIRDMRCRISDYPYAAEP